MENRACFCGRDRRRMGVVTARPRSKAHTGNVTVYRKANKPAFGPLGDSTDDFVAF